MESNSKEKYIAEKTKHANYLESEGYSAKIDLMGFLTIEHKDDPNHEVWGFTFRDYEIDDLFAGLGSDFEDEPQWVKLAIILSQSQDW